MNNTVEAPWGLYPNKHVGACVVWRNLITSGTTNAIVRQLTIPCLAVKLSSQFIKIQHPKNPIMDSPHIFQFSRPLLIQTTIVATFPSPSQHALIQHPAMANIPPRRSTATQRTTPV